MTRHTLYAPKLGHKIQKAKIIIVKDAVCTIYLVACGGFNFAYFVEYRHVSVML